MAKLIITGDQRQLEIIMTRARAAATKYGLEIEFTPDVKAESIPGGGVKNPPPPPPPPPPEDPETESTSLLGKVFKKKSKK